MMGGDNPAADPWWHPGDSDGSSVDVIDGHYSMYTGDLFEKRWQAGGGEGGAARQPVFSCLRSSPAPPPLLPLERISVDQPPSEGVMAAWLYPIVLGQDPDAHCLKQPVAETATNKTMATRSLGTMTAESKGKLAAADGMSGAKEDTNTRINSSEKKKASGGSSGRKGSSHHSATHNIREKRRRLKITERFRTLQQLVPGCDKSNQASTLDQTIQYMKSLQQQLQAMNTIPAPPAAVCPVAMPMRPTVAAVAPGTPAPAAGMLQYGAMLPYPHYTVMLPAAAAAPPWYPPAPGAGAFAGTPSPDATGYHAQCAPSPWNGSTKRRKGGGDCDRDGNGSR